MGQDFASGPQQRVLKWTDTLSYVIGSRDPMTGDVQVLGNRSNYFVRVSINNIGQ